MNRMYNVNIIRDFERRSFVRKEVDEGHSLEISVLCRFRYRNILCFCVVLTVLPTLVTLV